MAAVVLAAGMTACGGTAGSGPADSGPAAGVSASAAATASSTTVPADTVPSTTALTVAGTGPLVEGAAVPAGWQPFVTTDVTMAVPADWFDLKPTVADSPATKASLVEAVQGEVPEATEANIDDFLDGLDLWLGRLGPGEAMTMVRVAADPARRYPESDDSDLVQMFADTLKSNPPINGVKETVKVATIGDQRVVVADRSPSFLGPLPATERSYYLIVERCLVNVNFVTTGEPDFALWEQMVATAQVEAAR